MKLTISFWILFFLPFASPAQQLVEAQLLQTLTRTDIEQFFPFAGFDVAQYKITYRTPDVEGITDTASGLVVIPLVGDSIFPLLCYQHGTVNSRWDVPSRLSPEAQIGAATASLGYVSCLPDYLGLGDARGFHPYIHAATEASAALDLLRAAREFCQQEGISLNDQLFITGYSQGGHAAMALHREIETRPVSEFTVTAAAPLSGPYSISGVMLERLLSDEPYVSPSYLPYAILGYHTAYGLFDNLEQYFRPDYVGLVDSFYREVIDRRTFNTRLGQRLTAAVGAVIPRRMLQDSILSKAENNNDHPLRQAMADNDVYDWAPLAPTRLYYCSGDDQVIYTNSTFTDSVMNVRGASDVAAEDLGPELDHGGCVEPALLNALIFFELIRGEPTGASTAPFAGHWSVFPNPAREEVYISGAAGGHLLLFDINGRLLQQRQLPDDPATVPLTALKSGVYLLRLQTDTGIAVKRLVVK